MLPCYAWCWSVCADDQLSGEHADLDRCRRDGSPSRFFWVERAGADRAKTKILSHFKPKVRDFFNSYLKMWAQSHSHLLNPAREQILQLTREKPRFGYRRIHVVASELLAPHREDRLCRPIVDRNVHA